MTRTLCLCNFLFRCCVRVRNLHTDEEVGARRCAQRSRCTNDSENKNEERGKGPCLRLSAPCVGCWRQREPQKTARATRSILVTSQVPPLTTWRSGSAATPPCRDKQLSLITTTIHRVCACVRVLCGRLPFGFTHRATFSCATSSRGPSFFEPPSAISADGGDTQHRLYHELFYHGFSASESCRHLYIRAH